MKTFYKKATIEIAAAHALNNNQKKTMLSVINQKHPELNLYWDAPNGFLMTYDPSNLQKLSGAREILDWKKEASLIKGNIVAEVECCCLAKDLSVEITFHSVSVVSAE
jgi:hypothetical protein